MVSRPARPSPSHVSSEPGAAGLQRVGGLRAAVFDQRVEAGVGGVEHLEGLPHDDAVADLPEQDRRDGQRHDRPRPAPARGAKASPDRRKRIVRNRRPISRRTRKSTSAIAPTTSGRAPSTGSSPISARSVFCHSDAFHSATRRHGGTQHDRRDLTRTQAPLLRNGQLQGIPERAERHADAVTGAEAERR